MAKIKPNIYQINRYENRSNFILHASFSVKKFANFQKEEKKNTQIRIISIDSLC